jgi:signal peptide peptidase SppA, 67K type
MKQFFKFMFASALGTVLVFIIGFFIVIGSITATLSGLSKSTVVVKPNSVLQMKLDYEIPDRTNKNEFNLASLDFTTLETKDVTGLNDILSNIEYAATDPNIKGIYLNLSLIPTSTATLQEIRNKLIDFKKSGKFIISYAEVYGQSAYYLASVSDKIYLNPDGMLDLHGMSSQIMFYKNLLENLDIQVQIIRAPNNKFKSAVEPYFLDKMSDANREQMDKLLGSIWFEIITAISESRNVSFDELNKIANNLETYFDADNALKYKLVDGLLYKDQLIAELQQLTGSEKTNTISNGEYAKAVAKNNYSSNEIAVIYATGEITSGNSTEQSIGSESLSKTIRKAREDNKIKAIVFRVNSPGGSALASEVIRREVELATQVKPVIVSMGNYAASGGYWISTNANYIFADPTTLTGSIGVFGVFPNLQGFLNKKIGLTFDIAKTNENADFGSIAKPLSEFQYAQLQKNVAKTYDDFTSLVAKTRNLRQSYVDSIGQGRVWSGIDAIKLGLVDQLGGIEQAIAYAAEQANIAQDYQIIEMPKQKDMLQFLMEKGSHENELDAALRAKMGAYYTYFETIEKLSNTSEMQARIPFDLIVE